MTFESLLKPLADEKYAKFSASLIPNVLRERVLGVKIPDIRKLATTLVKENNEEVAEFLHTLPHEYLEEDILHGALIGFENDFDRALRMVEEFLPYIDNWEVCDTLNVKVFAKNKDKLKQKIYEWLDCDKTYTIRFAVVQAMRYFLDTDFDEELFSKTVTIDSDEYYVNMAVAWFLSVALIKHSDVALNYIKQGKISVWTMNKGIQKACESRRIDESFKKYLRTLKK